MTDDDLSNDNLELIVEIYESVDIDKKLSSGDRDILLRDKELGAIKKLQPLSQLGYVLHQPLRMLIKDSLRLSDAERRYTMNEMTHTDFMIFNKLNKMPVLVVEVDGHAYHADNPKQLKRDQMKDAILDKYGIPIIRFKTTGSEEERVLRDKLMRLMV